MLLRLASSRAVQVEQLVLVRNRQGVEMASRTCGTWVEERTPQSHGLRLTAIVRNLVLAWTAALVSVRPPDK